MKAPLYSQDGKQNGEIELPAELFAAKVNEHLVHLALVRQHANARTPAAHTLRRGEVAGSTAKLFRQKGTGRARVGDRRSSIRRGGGVAWGPRNTANYEKDLPKKARRGALASALSRKASDKKVFVLEAWTQEKAKTKDFEALKAKLPAGRSLLVVHTQNANLAKSARNLKYTKSLAVSVLNIHDLTKYDQILFEKAALTEATKLFKIEKKAAKAAA
jgi:large subunit ribosomal protein L4